MDLRNGNFYFKKILSASPILWSNNSTTKDFFHTDKDTRIKKNIHKGLFFAVLLVVANVRNKVNGNQSGSGWYGKPKKENPFMKMQ